MRILFDSIESFLLYHRLPVLLSSDCDWLSLSIWLLISGLELFLPPVKMYLGSTMDDDRLSSLDVLREESIQAKTLDFAGFVKLFALNHNNHSIFYKFDWHTHTCHTLTCQVCLLSKTCSLFDECFCTIYFGTEDFGFAVLLIFAFRFGALIQIKKRVITVLDWFLYWRL